MIDVDELAARLGKAKSRADRAKMAYDSASAEAARLETALSVVQEMMGVAASPPSSGNSLTTKQQILINSLKFGQNNSMSPADIYHVALQDSSFNGDISYVRTTLWRMADKGSIGSANGAYWRFEDFQTGQKPAEMRIPTGSLESRPPSTVNQWDSDLDDDAAF
jgi:hypothetical protein